jgi:chorismate dehydratase
MMLDKLSENNNTAVKIGRISYINVDPVYWGLEKENGNGGFEIVSAPPSELNRLLATGGLDISCVSSVAYARRQDEWRLLPGPAIACGGNVMSVLLVSRRPLERLNNHFVAISDESATASALVKLMFSLKGMSPRYRIQKVQNPGDIHQTFSAALVIGDAALRHRWRDAFAYVWDLGDLWARYAGLPFVFAVWAVRKKFAETYPERVAGVMDKLEESKRSGLSHLKEIVLQASEKLDIDGRTCRQYFENFCYDLGPSQVKGLEAFFIDLFKAKIFLNKVRLSFFSP